MDADDRAHRRRGCRPRLIARHTDDCHTDDCHTDDCHTDDCHTDDVTDALDTLTGPGGPFEVVTEDVRGVSLQVYKSRLHSMRDLIDMSNGRGETDFVVQGGRRLSYAGHNARVRATAAGLTARGLQRGDRVALLSANSP